MRLVAVVIWVVFAVLPSPAHALLLSPEANGVCAYAVCPAPAVINKTTGRKQFDPSGHLATIGSSAENDVLKQRCSAVGATSCFFGFTDYQKEGKWVWINGESVRI